MAPLIYYFLIWFLIILRMKKQTGKTSIKLPWSHAFWGNRRLIASQSRRLEGPGGVGVHQRRLERGQQRRVLGRGRVGCQWRRRPRALRIVGLAAAGAARRARREQCIQNLAATKEKRARRMSKNRIERNAAIGAE